jgi:hypothetical protein
MKWGWGSDETVAPFLLGMYVIIMYEAVHSSEEGHATAEGLNQEKGCNANHGRPAVQHFGIGRHWAKCLALGATEEGDEGCNTEEDKGESNTSGLVSPLLGNALTAGNLRAQCGNKCKHGLQKEGRACERGKHESPKTER